MADSYQPGGGQLPPIQPAPNQSINDKAWAEARHNEALAMQDSTAVIKKFIESARKAGDSWERITKDMELVMPDKMRLAGIYGKGADATQRLSSGANLSFDAMMKMPMHELFKDMSSLGMSVTALLNPTMLAATSLYSLGKGIKYVYDEIAHMNMSAQRTALGRGDINAAMNPSFSDYASGAIIRKNFGRMGYRDEDIARTGKSLTGTIGLSSFQNTAAMTSAGSIARRSDDDPSIVGKRIGEALKSGVSLKDFNKIFDETAAYVKENGLSLKEASEQTHSLFLASRALGVSYDDAKTIVMSFGGELQKGILTISDLANLDPAHREFSQNAGLIAMAKANGVVVKGVTDQENMVKAVGALDRLGPTARTKAVEKMYGAVKPMADRIGGDADTATGLRHILLGSGPFGGAPSGLKDSLLMGTSYARVRPDTSNAGTTQGRLDAESLEKKSADAGKALGNFIMDLKSVHDFIIGAEMDKAGATRSATEFLLNKLVPKKTNK